MKHHRALGALVALLAFGAVACGDGDTGDVSGSNAEVVTVDMIDNAFRPSKIEVKAGEEVTFRFRNDGKVVHEAIVGTAEEQAEHEAEMNDKAVEEEEDGDMTTMDHGGSDDDALSVEPGGTGELTHTFDEAEELLIGCHEPDHYEAGMKITVTVT
jgi:uncharacterized cupredoxin-like copper-binding protein